jgi:hypothetical protein
LVNVSVVRVRRPICLIYLLPVPFHLVSLAPSRVRDFPALSWRAVAFSAGGDGGGKLPLIRPGKLSLWLAGLRARVDHIWKPQLT